MMQKNNLEFYAVRNFIVEYNRTHRRQLEFIRACNPPMPDTLCNLNQRRLGIEVAHTYGSQAEAALRLGNCEIADFSAATHLERRLIARPVRAIHSLNKLLARKAKKTYPSTDCRALVRNDQIMDEQQPFPNANPATRQDGNEPSRARLQFEANDGAVWNAGANEDHARLTGPRHLLKSQFMIVRLAHDRASYDCRRHRKLTLLHSLGRERNKERRRIFIPFPVTQGNRVARIERWNILVKRCILWRCRTRLA